MFSLNFLSLVALSSALIFTTGANAAECTVTHNDNGTDDSEHILKAFTDCATDSVITFSQANYSAWTPVSLTGLSE